MNFTSIEYLFFVLFISALFYTLKPPIRIWLLILAGYCFYALLKWQYAILLFLMSLFTFIASNWIVQQPSKKWVLGSCIFVIGLPLLLFKYLNFFIENLTRKPIETVFLDYALPIGLSFYTFQMISYLVDIQRKYIKPEKDVQKILLHHAFFPILLAGPIERYKNIVNQFTFEKKFEYINYRNGLFQILWGLFKKIVIANSLAFYVNTVFKEVTKSNGFEVYLAMILFVFQIIVDFSAYNDIAMGSAKLFGIEITKNIHDRAYASTSRTQLWQRWHISLTSWLRDYIFFPLSKYSKSKTWLYINILIVYLFSGLWHGASWGFILWGLGNGIWLIFEQVTKTSRFAFFEKIGILNYPKIFNLGAWFVFLNSSAVFDVFFLSKNWNEIREKFTQLFTIQSFGFIAGKRIILISFMALFLLELVNRMKGSLEVYALLPQKKALRWLIYISICISLFYLKPLTPSSFMYFKF